MKNASSKTESRTLRSASGGSRGPRLGGPCGRSPRGAGRVRCSPDSSSPVGPSTVRANAQAAQNGDAVGAKGQQGLHAHSRKVL